MQRALEFALTLTASDDEASLNAWLLNALAGYWQPQGLLLGLPDVSGRQLECQGSINGRAVSLTLEVADYGHPFAHVLHKNQCKIWDALYGGARIDHAGFRELLGQLDADCGLYAVPIQDDDHKIRGVLGIFDAPGRLRQWSQTDELATLGAVYIRQLNRIRALRDSRFEHRSLRQRADETKQCQHAACLIESQLVGQSQPMLRLRQQINQMASHYLSVLIEGETGTGKDVVARLLHQCSRRASQPFVAINCAALPENLIESELFGYQKGAFSGAQRNQEGLIARANGGTLFLDEVGDMSLVMQAKLLRVLETHHYRPLGSDVERHSDFRVIAATHQPLSQRVEEGRFREDLWHRLCQSQILLPPLRDRAEDIAPLCHHFIALVGKRDNKPFGGLRRDLLACLMRYAFPGNVRELRNLMEIACAHTPAGEAITVASLPEEIIKRVSADDESPGDDFQHIRDLRAALEEYEATVINARLRYFQGNRLKAAESLNIARRTLDYRCGKLEVKR